MTRLLFKRITFLAVIGLFVAGVQSGSSQTTQPQQPLQGQIQQGQTGMGQTQGAMNQGLGQQDPTQQQFVGTFTLARIQQELQMRNVTREELRSRLARKGIILENIQEAQLPRFRDVIMTTIMEIQMEKTEQTDSKRLELERLFRELEAPLYVIPPSVRTVTEQDLRMRLLVKGIILDNIRAEQFPRYERIVSETLMELQAELEKEQEEDRLNQIYGHSAFKDNTLEIYRLTQGSSATENYVLGTGDQVRVTIFGTSTADVLLEVNEQGFVQPQTLPQIYLRGLNLKQARSVLQQRFSQYFTFRQDQFAVTVQETRPISVSIFGEVERTGTYHLSALNSVYNVVAVAGGPSPIGTVRHIEHIRGSQRKLVDVYALMRDPSSQYVFDLQQNDVINVPIARRVVRIEGAVKRPMRYEMLESESLVDLIEFAGGLAEMAYPDFVQIQRYDRGQLQLLEFNLHSVMTGEQVVSLSPGDVIRIRTSINEVLNKVSVAGFVNYPGVFGFREGLTAGEVIALAGGLRPSAFERAYVERRSLRDTTIANYIPINVGTSAGNNFALQANDFIMIFDRNLYSNIGDLSITGAVKETKRFTFDPNLTLYDLFTAAGGFAVGAAYNRVEVFRTTVYTDRPISMELITLELDDNYNVIKPLGGFSLKPYDQIVVRQTPGFQLSRTVEINGEVEYPGVYPLESRQTHLSDIIGEAGGLRSQADPIGSTLFRTEGERGFIITNLSDVRNNPRNEEYDPILFEGDVITIARRENIVSIRPTGTRMYMAVDEAFTRNSLNLTYQGDKSAKWYIQNYAGGFEKNADKSSVTVTLKNGQVLSTRRAFFVRRYPKVQSGSTIQVALKPEKLPSESGFDYDQFLTRTAQTTTSLLTIMLLIRQL
jgi:protein involved in polysaccharide export with SLBB domain